MRERTEHVQEGGMDQSRETREECGRSMTHNVNPDIAETEINTLSVSLQEDSKG